MRGDIMAMAACVGAVPPAPRSPMSASSPRPDARYAGGAARQPGRARARAVADRVLLFVAMAIAMLPAAYWAGGADKCPGHSTTTTSMREVLGQAMRSRPFRDVGAYVCGLNCFPDHACAGLLAICGQDPMLSAEALAMIGGVTSIGSLLTGWLGGRYPKHILLGLPNRASIMFAVYFMMPPTPTGALLLLRRWACCGGRAWRVDRRSGRRDLGSRYMATLLGLSFVVHQAGSSPARGAAGRSSISRLHDPAWQIGTLIGLPPVSSRSWQAVQPVGRMV